MADSVTPQGAATGLRERLAEAMRKADTDLFGNGECEDWYELADAVLAVLAETGLPLGQGGASRSAAEPSSPEAEPLATPPREVKGYYINQFVCPRCGYHTREDDDIARHMQEHSAPRRVPSSTAGTPEGEQ